MNSLDREPETKPVIKKETKKEDKKMTMPSDRKILETLYDFYGEPKDIVRENVKLYKSYLSPAGAAQGNWMAGEYQLGRVTVFTGYKKNPDDMYETTTIENEGIGSWFIGVTPDSLKVWIGGKLHQTLEIS